jgi:hypothetical protein
MTTSATYKCVSSSNAVRIFATYEEAYRFVMKEGDMSRLWILERVS